MAYVTTTSELATTALCSSFLTHEAGMLSASLAAEPHDLIWKNVTVSKKTRRLRSWIAGFCYLIIGLLWSAIVAFLATVAKASGELLVKWGMDPSSFLFTLIMRYLPITLQLGLLALIPIICQFTAANLEGLQSNHVVQGVIFGRYFLFQGFEWTAFSCRWGFILPF